LNHKVCNRYYTAANYKRFFLKQPLSNVHGYFFSFIILSPLPNCTCIIPIFYCSLFYLYKWKNHKSFSFRYKYRCLILCSNNENCLTINTDYVNFKCIKFLFNIYIFSVRSNYLFSYSIKFDNISVFYDILYFNLEIQVLKIFRNSNFSLNVFQKIIFNH